MPRFQRQVYPSDLSDAERISLRLFARAALEAKITGNE
jgi:hypothetical protein